MSYQEMDESGQYNIDVRLEADRDLEENVGVVIEFASKQHRAEVEDNLVKNRYEGYGLLVEKFGVLQAAVKQVGTEIQLYQKILPIADARAVDAAASIDNSLSDVIIAALKMDAEAKRVGDDLYANAPVSPLEEYAESQSKNDGFEEAPETPSDDENDPDEENIDDEGKDATEEENGDTESDV